MGLFKALYTSPSVDLLVPTPPEPRYNYCTKTIRSHIHHGLRPGTHIHHGLRPGTHIHHGLRPGTHIHHGLRPGTHIHHGLRPGTHIHHGLRPGTHLQSELWQLGMNETGKEDSNPGSLDWDSGFLTATLQRPMYT